MPVSYDSLHTCLPMVAGIDRTADWSGQGNGITEVASPTAGTMGVPAAWGGLNEVAILDVSAGPVTLTATKVDFAPTFGSHEFIHILTGAKATFDPVFGSHSFAHALVATEAVFSTTFGAHEFSHALVGTKTTFDATFGSHSFAHELIATKADFATVFGSHTISELYILTASKATFDAVFGSHSFAHELVATKVDFPPTFGSHIISTAIILVATKAEFAAIFGSHALVESVLLTAAKVTFDTVFHGGLIIGLDPVVSCGLWSTQQVFNPCDQWRITLTGPSANNVSVTAVVRFE